MRSELGFEPMDKEPGFGPQSTKEGSCVRAQPGGSEIAPGPGFGFQLHCLPAEGPWAGPHTSLSPISPSKLGLLTAISRGYLEV